MKLLNRVSQSDSNSSFLDVSLCLLVVFILLFAASIVEVKKRAKKSEKTIIKSKSKKIKRKYAKKISLAQIKIEKLKREIKQYQENVVISKRSNRYKGRGGQPSLPMNVSFDGNFNFNIGGRDYSWREFRSLICNIDRQEGTGIPSFLFNMNFDSSFDKITTEDLNTYFNGKVSYKDVNKAVSSHSRFAIFSLLKKSDVEFEMLCRKFKLQNTSSEIGNWDGDDVCTKKWTSYKERRSLKSPFLWFSVDKNRNVLLGPTENPLILSSREFVSLIGSIKGGDGFYIEYRNLETLEYNPSEQIPQWVQKEIIESADFGVISGS